MPLFNEIPSTAGKYSGKGLITAFKIIAANFGLINPVTQDSGAADYILEQNKTLVTRSRATAQTVTIPLNATLPIPIGTRYDVIVADAGVLTVQGATGAVTLTKLAAKTLTAAQGARVVLIKIGTNAWHVSGDLTAA